MKFNKLFVPLIVLLGLGSASASLQPGAKWGLENDKALLDRLHQEKPLPLNDPDVLRMDSIYKKEGDIRRDMDQKRPPRAELMPIEQDILKAASPDIKKFVGDRMRQLPPVGAPANQPPLQQIGQGVKNLGTQVGNEVKNIGIKVVNTLGITPKPKPKPPANRPQANENAVTPDWPPRPGDPVLLHKEENKIMYPEATPGKGPQK